MTKYTVDQLPQTDSGKRMLSYVAPIYENSFWLKSFYDALGVDFDLLTKFFSTLRDQTHIASVNWGIEFLEHKYSVTPAPHLSLEERRARLRIKATQHLPLNPAVLEKFARENFGLECWLDEKKPGFIRILANHFPETTPKFVDWLLEEKPAHLALGGEILLFQYLGDEKLAEPDDEPRIYLEPPLPKSDFDKRHFPRMFADIANLITGTVTTSIAKPATDFESQTFAGMAIFDCGDKQISLRTPPTDFESMSRVGMVIKRVGDVRIKSSTPSPDDGNYFGRSWTSQTFAGMATAIFGRKVWSLSQPSNQKIPLNVGIVETHSGSVTIGFDNRRNFNQSSKLNAAQVLTKVGDIRIDTDTKPADDGNYFAKTWTAQNFAGVVEHKTGSITFKDSSARRVQNKTVIRVGQTLTRSGFITIGCSDLPDDWDVPQDGEWLRLFFDFTNTRPRTLLIKNPRQDLKKQHIRDVGEVVAEGKLLLNAAGDYSTGITRAWLIKQRVTQIL